MGVGDVTQGYPSDATFRAIDTSSMASSMVSFLTINVTQYLYSIFPIGKP